MTEGPSGGTTRDLAQRLPRLLEAMVAVGSDAALPTLLDRIVDGAAGLTGARLAALAVLNDEGEVGQFVTRGLDREVREEVSNLPGYRGLVRTLVEASQPMLVDDLAADARFADFPAALTGITSLLGVPVRVHGAGFGALYLGDSRRAAFTSEDLQLIEILATEAGIAIGNARLYDALRQRARWMDGSAVLSTSLLSGEADEAPAVVAEQGRRLADAEAALVLITDEQGGLRAGPVDAEDPAILQDLRMQPEEEILGQLLAGEPVFLDDPAADRRLHTAVAERFGPAMVLPLANDGRVLGALAVLRGRGAAPFTLAERAMANQFAQQAAVALVVSEARQDRERLAIFEDRDRIARDLHDLVIQRLFATGMLLQSAQRTAGDQTSVNSRIGEALDELDATIQEIRTAIFSLQQSPEEAPAGLRTRVLREASAVSGTLGFRPSVSFTGPIDTRVGEATAQNLVAALREALSNVARHAAAGRVEVTVDATVRLPDGRESVRMTVADDGQGLGDRTGRRSGLRNIAQRADSLGGSTTFSAGLGAAGTTVTWEAPL